MADQDWKKLYELEKIAREKAQKLAVDLEACVNVAEERARVAETRAESAERKVEECKPYMSSLVESIRLATKHLAEIHEKIDEMKGETRPTIVSSGES